MMPTRRFTPRSGSAFDPLVEEVTWSAWELTAADPARATEAAVQAACVQFDCLVETAWRPGRSCVIAEVEWDPNAGGSGRLAARLGIGVFGPLGTTASDALGLRPRAANAIGGAGILAGRPIDPDILVPGDPGRRPIDGHVAHIAQRTWTLDDEHEAVEIVSRFAPTVEPWTGIVDQLARAQQPVRVRATALATMLAPDDRLELDQALRTVGRIRERGESRPEITFDAGRAEATLLDLRASLTSPAVIGEVAVTSSEPLPETLLRSLAASFTSEFDVLRQQGRIVVATNRLLAGGYELHRDPPEAGEAIALGVPARGGLGNRSLRDLLSLAESPIGWPIPLGKPLPTIATRLPIERAVPAALTATSPSVGTDARTVIGRSPGGVEVSLPLELRTRHLLATGSWGSGKSTLQFTLALDDLRHDRPFVFIDPHGTSADLLIAHARHLGQDPVVIDAADGRTHRVRLLPRFGRSPRQRAAIDAAVRRVSDAVSSSQLNPEWTGPRWFACFNALLELVVVHGGELVDAAVWLNDASALTERTRHPDVSPLAGSTLRNLTTSTGDGSDVRGWVSSKLHPLVSGAARSVIAPVGKGIDIGAAAITGRPVIVSLAGLSTSEGAMVSHLISSAVVDAAFDRPLGERSLITLFTDEIHRSPSRGLTRVLAEGRKFGVGLVAATQGLGQLTGELADLAMAAGTQVAFRATPDTASRLGPLLDLSPGELMAQPDLHATVLVVGQPATTVIVPPYEPCPVPRVVSAPTGSRGRSRRTGPMRPKPTTTGGPKVVLSPSPPASPTAGRSLVDEFLAFRSTARLGTSPASRSR